MLGHLTIRMTYLMKVYAGITFCANIKISCYLVILQKEQLWAMLDEDTALMERRTQIAKRLELYKQARDDIDSVAWR